MEVHIDDIPRVGSAFVVAGMLPLTADTGIPQDLTAVHVAERGAQFTTVRDLIYGQPVR